MPRYEASKELDRRKIEVSYAAQKRPQPVFPPPQQFQQALPYGGSNHSRPAPVGYSNQGAANPPVLRMGFHPNQGPSQRQSHLNNQPGHDGGGGYGNQRQGGYEHDRGYGAPPAQAAGGGPKMNLGTMMQSARSNRPSTYGGGAGGAGQSQGGGSGSRPPPRPYDQY
ncbi:hypothetical protein T439DRAFT_60725 [Meredithblackwellia eburnea MCA 4105]